MQEVPSGRKAEVGSRVLWNCQGLGAWQWPSLRDPKNLLEGHCSLIHKTPHCYLSISTGSNRDDNIPEMSWPVMCPHSHLTVCRHVLGALPTSSPSGREEAPYTKREGTQFLHGSFSEHFMSTNCVPRPEPEAGDRN